MVTRLEARWNQAVERTGWQLNMQTRSSNRAAKEGKGGEERMVGRRLVDVGGGEDDIARFAAKQTHSSLWLNFAPKEDSDTDTRSQRIAVTL